jgi:hypothetical protein
MLGIDAWVRPRDGLTSVFDRLSQGSAAIAYLGLSVTAQRDGFRPRLHVAIEHMTGRAHRAINAGVGGVGSVSMAFLMDQLVIAHRPALCFIECTTGDIDGRTPVDDAPRAIEGVLRKLAAIDCAACILHLYQREQSRQTSHPILAGYERVADHYGVPSIDAGHRIEDDIAEGRADADALFRDVVHTTPDGADVVAHLIVDALAFIRTQAGPAEGRLGERTRCTDGAFDRGLVVDARPEDCNSTPATGRFRLTCPFVDVDASNAIHFRREDMALAGFAFIAGPTTGVVRVSTASGDADYQTWDRWCVYDRLSTVVFPAAIPAGMPVTIRPIAPSRLRLVSFFCIPR